MKLPQAAHYEGHMNRIMIQLTLTHPIQPPAMAHLMDRVMEVTADMALRMGARMALVMEAMVV